MVTELRKPGIDLVRQVRNAVIAIDLEQRIVLWNSFAETLYQWKAEEALGRNIMELIVPDEARIAAEEIIESLKETGHWDDEFVVRAKDGHTFPVYVDLSAIRGTNGEVIGFVGASTDVTQLKRLNRALQESEERFRSFMNHLPGYAWIKNADGSYVYMNKRLEEVLPKRQDDWVGRTDTDFWPPEIAAQFQINDRRVLRSGQELQAVEPWIREGQVRHSLVSKFPIFDAQGNAIMVGGASIDITEHKRAEQALRENQSHLQAILDYCPAMIFLKDLDGRYLQVNRELERTFNLTSEQVVGRTDAEVFPPELAVAFRATDESVLGAGCPIESEEEALYDGGPHTYIVHKFPLRDAAGDIYAVGGISTDITARKLEEDELRRQKEVLQKIFDHIPVLINFIGQDGRLKLVNREWERTLGWSLEEIVNQDIDVLREAYPDPQDHKNVLNFVATANAKWGAFRTRVRDGRVIDTAWANIRLSDGTSVGIGQDITEQKRAQDALLESHNLQRAVVDGTPDAVFVKDRQGRYQMINSAGAGFVGKQVEEIIGRDDADLFPPETVREIRRVDQEVMASGKAQTFEQTATAAGMTRTYLTTKDVYRDSKGAVIGVIGIARDITGRKRVEEALRASEERYRDLVENAHDIIYSHDLEGNYTSVNKAVEQITGYSREEALKINLAQIIAPEYLEQARSMIQRKLAGEKETVYDLEIVAKDGRRIAVEVNTRLIYQDGVPVGIHGIARDVTERKRVQEELRESEERYRDLVENSTELICTHDLDGLILSANRAAIEVLGFDPKDWVGKRNLRDILAPEVDPDELDDYLARIRRDGNADGVMLVQTRSGVRRIWEYHNTLRTKGVLTPIVRGMARDITERKRAEEALRATSDQLRALSASVQSAREEEGARIARELHDELGSALTSLKWDLEGIDKLCSQSVNQMDFLPARKKIEGMMGLIDATINTVTRISSELRPSLLDDLGLAAAIEWQARQFEGRAGITCECDSFVEDIELSREKATAIFRIFQEALTNILRHAQATRVNITMEEERGEFVLQVRDNGRGIAENEKTGARTLGLIGMRERVHLVGGGIEVTGVAGKGTVLTVRVPIHSQATE
jgi:PAS domain S-box-containing protein